MKLRLSSLSLTLTLAMVGCVVLVSSLVVSLNLFITSKQTWNELENKADEYATYLSGSLEQPLWSLDEAAVRSITSNMLRNDLIVRLNVKDTLLKILYEQWAPDEGETIFRKVPITHKQKVIGMLELEISTRSYHERINSMLFSSMMTMAAVLVTLFILTGLIFNRLLQRPLQSLLNRIDYLSKGKPVPPGIEARHQELNEIITRLTTWPKRLPAGKTPCA